MALKYHYFWYVQVTHKSYFIITLFLSLSLWDLFYYVTTTFFQVQKIRILNNRKGKWYILYSYVLTTYGNTIQLLCVLRPHFWITVLWYDCITYWNNGTATFRFRLILWRNFITLQICLFKWFVFWWRQNYVELWKLLKRVNCI